MLKPATPCTIATTTGNDINGRPTFANPKGGFCSVVKLVGGSRKTNLKTTQSGSAGNAEVKVGDSVLLFLPKTDIRGGYAVKVGDLTLYVNSVEFRYNPISGDVDHLEVTLNIHDA